ncbi:AAC(3) family N-acetyltransferase [Natrialbaceae archaeon A-CW2]
MSKQLFTEVKRLGYLPIHQIYKIRNSRRSTSPGSEDEFEQILQKHADGESKVFVHAGLSDIRAAFDADPYVYLRDSLDRYFESILTPGFTDYFKTSGVYHLKYSRPKHGTFGKLFLKDSDYRTRDAIKSILVKGPYRFEECNHHDSYSPEGCFAKLVKDNVLVMNVGTQWITCSHLHYFESKYNVDYVIDRTYEGVIYTDDTEYRQIEQSCSVYTSKYYSWNKPKLQRLLEERDVLHRYDLNGLNVWFFKLGDIEEVLGEKLQRDPFYLVTM